jgi:hypothetical protein
MAADQSRLFFLAAPFTLLVSVAVGLFGPPPPSEAFVFTGPQLLWLVAVPGLSAALAQLVVNAIVLRPQVAPRLALAAAFAAWPILMLYQAMLALPLALAFVMLVVPSIWLFGRLLFVAGPVVICETSHPSMVLQRSWDLTRGHDLQLSVFVVIGVFAVLGIGLLADIAGSAAQVVAKLAGLESFGRFLRVLLPGIGATFTTMGAGVASAIAYRQLVR